MLPGDGPRDRLVDLADRQALAYLLETRVYFGGESVVQLAPAAQLEPAA